ncbi:MAG: hypothetical protein HFG56_01925 [Lachnospiraceae bacterium]|jgi:hypothetical protein|nr:hypothetical protein [Lachnospiraceae bacterium]MCI9282029.1 hypothetical protein [Lachnospiraceae bacterium]
MNEDAGTDVRLTDFDYLLADPHLQMVKAAIPYMQQPVQRFLSMVIKMQELNRTMSLFSGNEVSAMSINPAGERKASPIEMLQAIKPYANPRERELIETIENLQIMLQAMQTG